jgi:hypothetical protein
VPAPEYKVAISKPNLSLKPDANTQLSVSVSPDVYYETYWTSTNPAIAEVLADGTVIGHEHGTASVIANVILPSTGAVFAVAGTVFVEEREIIIEESAPVGSDGYGTTRVEMEIPKEVLFEGSFTVEVPVGVTIDALATQLSESLSQNMELTVEQMPGANTWVFTITIRQSAQNAGMTRATRATTEFETAKIVDIVYDVDEEVADGDYDLSISDLKFAFQDIDNTVIERDETVVSITVEAKADTGIISVGINEATPAKVVGYYNLMGERLNKEPESGLYIIQYDNGTAKKVMRNR